MKKIKLSLIIYFVTVLVGVSVNSAFAQGSCTCIVGGNRTCGVQNNNCESGYYPVCAPLTRCSPVYPDNCTCRRNDDGQTPDCGGQNQICCPGSTCDTRSLRCYMGYCLTEEQINPPAGGFPEELSGEFQGDCPDDHFDTAVGCIPIGSIGSTARFATRLVIGIGGGIAFVLVIYAGFMIMTSTGNPDRLKAGQELLTSAIAGIILIVFSVFLLRVIGVDILGLPGFGG